MRMSVASRVRWVWNELTRKRSFRGHRSDRRGIAILMVITSLMVMTVLITELVYTAQVKTMVTIHERDRVKAYWLARSGVNMHRLILLANKEISNNPQIGQALEMIGGGGSFEFWQTPFVQNMNTSLLRMLLGAGGDIDSVEDETLEEFKKTGRYDDADDPTAEAGFFDDRDFLDFEGDFNSEITDHESRVNVNAFAAETFTTVQESPTGQFLYAMMSSQEDLQWFRARNLDPWELIGNLKDWVDQDTVRSGGRGGYEDTLYNTLDPPYFTKNAPFDSVEEIRIVAGWEGEVCDKYCDRLTVYGDPAAKINMNSMPDEFILALVNMCIEGGTPLQPAQIDRGLAQLEQQYPLGPMWNEPKDLAKDMVNVAGFPVNQSCISEKLITKSQTFTITSTGLVGTSEVTIEAVMDFTSNAREGSLVYWRVR